MKRLLLAVLLIALAMPATAQVIQPYGNNYFLVRGIDDARMPTGEATEDVTDVRAKFRIGQEMKVFHTDKLPELFITGFYAMKGYWDIGEPSGPFRAYNHNFGLGAKWYREGIVRQIAAFADHESNGENDTESAGWDKVNGWAEAEVLDYAGYTLTLYPKVWWVMRNEDTIDGISDFTSFGYDRLGGELTAKLLTPNGQTIFVEIGRHHVDASLLVDLIPHFNDFTVILNYFDGYRDDLRGWDESTRAAGVGLALAL